MPRKPKLIAGPPAARPWTAAELATLRRKFPVTTNRDLAELLQRGIKSIIWQGAKLGLLKSLEHRSEQSRQTALANPQDMVALGSLGGQMGGKARAKALKPAARKKIAKAAIAARWVKRDSNI
jgi:hypothetical protein